MRHSGDMLLERKSSENDQIIIINTWGRIGKYKYAKWYGEGRKPCWVERDHKDCARSI